MEHKTCTKCGRELPATTEYFYKEKSGKYGLNGRCKECKNKYFKKYGEINRDRILEEKKKWYYDNKEKDNERNKQYREENREQILNYHKQYRKNNKDKINEYLESNKERIAKVKKEYSIKNREQIRIHAKQWIENNKDKAKERKKRYLKSEKGKIAKFKSQTRRRKSEKDSLKYGFITLEQWNQCKLHFNNSCCYCGKESNRLEKEHFIPISKGGKSDVTNILPSCKSCNSSKCDEDFGDWYPKQKYYSRDIEKNIYNYLKTR